MTATSFLHWAEPLAKPGAMAAAYYVIGRLGLLLAIPPGYATAVWPASGVALAGTLLFGYRVWPGILLGSFLINLRTSLDITSTESILTTTALAASIGMEFATGHCRRFPDTPLYAIPDRVCRGARYHQISDSGRPGKLPRECHMGCDESAVGRCYPAGRLPVPLVDLVGGRCDWSHYLYSPDSDLGSQTSRVLTGQTSLPAAVSGITLVVIFFIYTNAWEQDRIRLEFKRRTDHLAQQLEENFDNYIDVLHSVGNLYASSVPINRQQFKTFVSRWFSRHPGIRAVSWSPRILDSERANYEQAAREDGLSNFQITEQSPQGQLVRAARRAEYIPVYYLNRSEGMKSFGF